MRPSTSTTTDHVLCIDPCGIAQMIGHKIIPVELLSLLIDSGIQLPAPFRTRIIAARQQAGISRNPAALSHLPANIPEIRNRVMDAPVTSKKPAELEAARSRRQRRRRDEEADEPYPPPQQPRRDRWQRNQRAYNDNDRWYN